MRLVRHLFVRMCELTYVRGRIDYMSDPKRKKHLYAVYSTLEPELCKYSSEQEQREFWKTTG